MTLNYTRLNIGIILVALSGAALFPANASAKQQTFDTPEAAAQALVAALKSNDDAKLLALFGKEHERLLRATDPITRQADFEELAAAASQAMSVETLDADSKEIIIGSKRWPFPIPLVKDGGAWRFDTAAGAEEILNRVIGENELEAIGICRAFVAAQVEYARVDRDGDQVLEYAHKVVSTTGQRDGLYWDVAGDEELSPFGPALAEAAAHLEAAKRTDKAVPYHGYYFKVLKRQGARPPGGEYDYEINGNMIAGFALIAVPSDYGNTGIMTLVVSHQGKVYEKDLGKTSLELAKKMTSYDPDDTWKLVED